MKVARVIPCLDVSEGRVVKGVNFENLRDAGDPIELASLYDREGADELVFLDITASHENRETAFEMARAVAENIFIPFTIGGGIKTLADARAMLRAGADKISINSAAVQRPPLVNEIAEEFGSQCCVVAIDGRRMAEGSSDFAVYTHGGRNQSALRVVAWAKEVEERGAGEILLTSMDRDGTQSGFDLEMTAAVTEAVNIPVIASGGVGSCEDFPPAVLEGGASGLLAASIFHYKKATIREVKQHLLEQKVTVRPVT